MSEKDTTLSCPHCGGWLISRAASAYRDAHWRASVLREAPKEVWEAYRADGIGLMDALSMELSYAG